MKLYKYVYIEYAYAIKTYRSYYSINSTYKYTHIYSYYIYVTNNPVIYCTTAHVWLKNVPITASIDTHLPFNNDILTNLRTKYVHSEQ